jgi:hypothetical protein
MTIASTNSSKKYDVRKIQMKYKTLLFVSSFLFSAGCLCLIPSKAKANHQSYCNNHPFDLLSGCTPFKQKQTQFTCPGCGPKPKPVPPAPKPPQLSWFLPADR